uniref:Uncharacterized protein n=1 Tax=Micrurus lemniscatus lemniscatus TaxID=129467 RepID=A0A2D4JP87_MICLE
MWSLRKRNKQWLQIQKSCYFINNLYNVPAFWHVLHYRQCKINFNLSLSYSEEYYKYCGKNRKIVKGTSLSKQKPLFIHSSLQVSVCLNEWNNFSCGWSTNYRHSVLCT